MQDNIEDIFNRLDADMRIRAGLGDNWCEKGLSNEQINAQENALGIVLPDDFRWALAKFDGFYRGDHMPMYAFDDSGNIALASRMCLGSFLEWRTYRDLVLDDIYAFFGAEDDEIPGRIDGRVALVDNDKWFPLGCPLEGVMWYFDFYHKSSGEICVVAPGEFFAVVANNYTDFMGLIIKSIHIEYNEDGSYIIPMYNH